VTQNFIDFKKIGAILKKYIFMTQIFADFGCFSEYSSEKFQKIQIWGQFGDIWGFGDNFSIWGQFGYLGTTMRPDAYSLDLES
jgi:hypothetical protein